MRNKFKCLLAIIITTFIGLLTLLGPLSAHVEAAGFVENGKWQFNVDKDLPMGASYFSDTVIVERENDNYYLTFSILDKANVDKLSLVKGNGRVGVIERRNGKRIDYTFTVSEDDLKKPLTFKCFIVAMGKNKEFKVNIKPETKRNLSDFIDNLGERPGIFVPRILVDAGDSEMNLGSYYQAMPAKATIEDEEIPVTISSYYLKDNEKIEVELKDNRFMLENIGEYHLIYRAESPKYKTSLGNNSYAEVDVKIISKINAASLAKVKAIKGNEVLPDNISVQALALNNSNESYNLISNKLKDISDHYEVTNVTIYDIDGKEITLSDEVELYLYANPSYDRTKIEVYHLSSDGELIRVNTENYGRYMRLITDELGTYVILVPGVAFIMPMWAIATMTIVGALVLIGAITTITIVVVKKRKNYKRLEDVAY